LDNIAYDAVKKGAALHKTSRSSFSVGWFSVILTLVVTVGTINAHAAPAPAPAAPAAPTVAPATGMNCPCPEGGGNGWNAMGGGFVRGGHRFNVELDAWKQNYFALSYLYGLSSALAFGLYSSVNFLEDTTTSSTAINEGFVLGVPIMLSLLNSLNASARLGLTPGFVHSTVGDRYMGFWLKLEANYGFWLKRNVMLLGPSVLWQMTTGRGIATNVGGDPVFRMPFMGGMFVEFHVTDWMALTAQLMFGAMYDMATGTTGQNLTFAYRTVLGLSFQVPAN